jgi:hypothetical protein
MARKIYLRAIGSGYASPGKIGRMLEISAQI